MSEVCFARWRLRPCFFLLHSTLLAYRVLMTEGLPAYSLLLLLTFNLKTARATPFSPLCPQTFAPTILPPLLICRKH
eukprot:g59486.t1